MAYSDIKFVVSKFFRIECRLVRNIGDDIVALIIELLAYPFADVVLVYNRHSTGLLGKVLKAVLRVSQLIGSLLYQCIGLVALNIAEVVLGLFHCELESSRIDVVKDDRIAVSQVDYPL